MVNETWENDNKTWQDEIDDTKRKMIIAFTEASERPLQDLIDGSVDMSQKMDIGTAIAILIGELQRQEKRIKRIEDELGIRNLDEDWNV